MSRSYFDIILSGCVQHGVDGSVDVTGTKKSLSSKVHGFKRWIDWGIPAPSEETRQKFMYWYVGTLAEEATREGIQLAWD